MAASFARMRAAIAAGACVALVAGCAVSPPRTNAADLQRQVADTERAFAKTMADRDHAAFATFTSIWRLEAPGVWRIIFDKGNEVCDCPKAP